MAERIVIEVCPVHGCGEKLHYTHGGAVCGADHRFNHYVACGGLLPIGADRRPSGPMYVPHGEVMRMLDTGARLWNALVWYSGDKRKFWGRLLGLMETLRDEAHSGPDGTRTTQMDTEAERLRADLGGAPPADGFDTARSSPRLRGNQNPPAAAPGDGALLPANEEK